MTVPFSIAAPVMLQEQEQALRGIDNGLSRPAAPGL
jgi:hypothetical protein